MTRTWSLIPIIAALLVVPQRAASADEIVLSEEKRTKALEEAARLEGRFVAPKPGAAAAAIVGAASDMDREIVVTGTLVGKGEQVLQIRNEALNLDYVVHYSRALEIAAPAGQQVVVHGLVQQVDSPARRITVRALQVDGPKSGDHHH